MDNQEAKILYYFFLSALLLGIMLYMLFRNMVKHYKRMQRLHKALTTIAFETLEKERQRIKADLHDELAPLLAATGNTILHIATTDERNNLLIQTAVKNTELLIDKLRKISFDLVPTSLMNSGLIAAVDELVNSLQLTTEISIYFSHSPMVAVQPDTARHVYRIVSEALHNSIQHSGAENCNVDLRTTGNWLKLTVVDDGVGLKHSRRGNGLNNMALRAELLNGKLFLNSKHGEGVDIQVEIPI